MDHEGYIAATKNQMTFADRCKRGKSNPAYLPGTVGLKDVRLSANQNLDIRVRTRIGVTGGHVSGSEVTREYETRIYRPKVIAEPQKASRRARKAIQRQQDSDKRQMMRSALYYG